MTLTSLLSVLRLEQPVEFGNQINKSDLPKKFQIFRAYSLVVINKHDRQTERQCLCCHLLLPKTSCVTQLLDALDLAIGVHRDGNSEL